jgi:CMP-N-acetylneuraminic acid synthetase
MEIRDAYIMLLQVTCALRTLDDLNSFCKAFEDSIDTAQAIVSIIPHDSPHPDKIQKLENGYVTSYMGKESMIARQTLPKVYALNGAFYLTHTDILKTKKTFIPERTIPFIMPPERSVNLDTIQDVYILEALLEKGVVELEEY